MAEFSLLPADVVREEIVVYLSVDDLFRFRRTCQQIHNIVNEELVTLNDRDKVTVLIESARRNIVRNICAVSVHDMSFESKYYAFVEACKCGNIRCALCMLCWFTHEQVIRASFEVLIWKQYLACRCLYLAGDNKELLWLALSGDLNGVVQALSGNKLPEQITITLLQILASKAGYEYIIYFRNNYSTVTRYLSKIQRQSAIYALRELL